MIVVTGQPRCGTSMMMRCLNIAGVPLAFEEQRGRDVKTYRNPYGFFEGRHDGKDGCIKIFSPMEVNRFQNQKIVYMYRDPAKVEASWDEVRSKLKQPKYIDDQSKRRTIIIKRFETVEKWVGKYPYIKVDYDKFVTDPESYRLDFERVFPELYFDKIKSGIDSTLYKER